MFACDGGDPPKCDFGNLVITVDSNLNLPQITQPSGPGYSGTFYIREDQNTEQIITTVRAIDIDSSVSRFSLHHAAMEKFYVSIGYWVTVTPHPLLVPISVSFTSGWGSA